MVTEKDYYKVLGVKDDASTDEIKKAFKKLARKHHPDAGGDETRFKDISEAYDVLSDKDKRTEYDTFRKYGAYGGAGGGGGSPFNWGGGGGAAGAGAGYWRNVGDFGDMGNLGDIFSRIRHGEGAFGTDWNFPGQAVKGREVQVTLNVSFEEAFNGVEKTVTIRRDGQSQKLEVKVPAGATDGGKLRYKGKGGVGKNGGANGDLLIVTAIKPHELYSRKGADVVMDLPISMVEATLGAQIVVPTPDGSKVKLRVPAGAQKGKTLVVGGKGAKKIKGDGFGDLKVQIKLIVAEQLNEKQRAALEAFAEASDASGADIRPQIVKATTAQSAEATVASDVEPIAADRSQNDANTNENTTTPDSTTNDADKADQPKEA